ncbi:hypothetical protein D915_000979 [Fasciola hepatica]|uniref:DH domain-containing protein n=1 Tax=Fasciola hepatica TaxID=6192 RepID=A0A4E0S2Y7_FASHE|nr:hypothetical protein D915_000979 [Fasciola hepatica]
MNTEPTGRTIRERREQLLKNQVWPEELASYERKMNNSKNNKPTSTSNDSHNRNHGDADNSISQRIRSMSGRVNSDAAQYRSSHPVRAEHSRTGYARIRASVNSLNQTCTPVNRKSESEPGTWPSAFRSHKIRDVTTGTKQYPSDQSVYPKRPPPGLPHSRHHRTEGKRNSRSNELHPRGSWTNETTGQSGNQETRRSSECGTCISPRHQVSSSMDNLVSVSKHSLLHRRKQHSDSPTNKQRPLSLSNLNIDPDTITVRLWNGYFVSLDGLLDKNIGEALKEHLMEANIPVECVDSNTNKHISWDTPLRNVNRKMLVVQEIGNSSATTVTPSTPGKRLEKRMSSTASDRSKAMQEWFDYCTRHDCNEMSTSELLELRCFLERPPPCIDLDGDGFGLDEHCRSFILAGKQSELFAENCSILRNNLERHRKHLFSLDESWNAFVKTEKPLTSREHKRQSAIWEIFVTELNYINSLRAILDTYSDPFHRIREKQFLHLDGLKIFNNLEQIFSINLRLWFGYMHPAYCKFKEANKPLDAFMLQPGFHKIPRMFIPYTEYCLRLQTCQKYIKWAARTNPSFASFLQWANDIDSEHREGLQDRVAKPFKRITQYNLMLENVRKFCDDPEELKAIDRMHTEIGELLKVIDLQMRRVEQSGRMELLESELLFTDCPEKLDEDYKILFDKYKRAPLLEDIELPAPVILTQPEVMILLRQRQASSAIDAPFDTENSFPPIISPNSLYENDLLISGPDNMRSPNKTEPDHWPCNPIKQSNGVKNDANQMDSIHRHSSIHGLPVMLTRWDPPSGYKVSKLNMSILDRVRSTRIPAESRRTVPRSLLRKGVLRFREAQGKWTDTTCFLLTDQFIIGKSQKGTSKSHVKVHRPPIRLDKLVVHKPSDAAWFACAALDDFNMIVSVHTFHADKARCNDWCNALTGAKERYLELMRPEIVYVSPQGTIPPNWFFRRRSLSSPRSQSFRSQNTSTEDRQHRTLLALSNSSTRRDGDSVVRIPYRRPVRPNLFNPPKDSTLMVSDNRARPIPTPQPDGRRTMTPIGQTRATLFFNPTHSGQPRIDSPLTAPNTSIITGRNILDDDASARSYPIDSFRRSVRSEPTILPQVDLNDEFSDGISDLPQSEDRVITIQNAYGNVCLRDAVMQSTPDLKGTLLRNSRNDPLGSVRTDSRILNGDSVGSRDTVRAPAYRSTMRIFQGETQSSSTRC